LYNDLFQNGQNLCLKCAPQTRKQALDDTSGW